MADVDGSLMNGSTFDPLRENAGGADQDATTFDPLREKGNATEIFNTSVGGGGGGATIVRQNPELTRTNP